MLTTGFVKETSPCFIMAISLSLINPAVCSESWRKVGLDIHTDKAYHGQEMLRLQAEPQGCLIAQAFERLSVRQCGGQGPVSRGPSLTWLAWAFVAVLSEM